MIKIELSEADARVAREILVAGAVALVQNVTALLPEDKRVFRDILQQIHAQLKNSPEPGFVTSGMEKVLKAPQFSAYLKDEQRLADQIREQMQKLEEQPLD